ncbi:SCP2 sterol-binding domain-containing protein [Bacilliculturomica massiliensis]|uniref:SCP2 sterol-binding domain-containing protein n=1 Tax=Bacilliculturomica massiliensis TaxID=1917867 RepID=UPI001030863E|nr:SCP2 sterol-binding domain-containing protein [Bacilliculturomica massiliensis]
MAEKKTENTTLAEKAQTAVVEKPEMETGIVEKKKAETAVVKKVEGETAVVKKDKAQRAVVKKEKGETAVVKKDKAQTSVVKKEKAQTAIVKKEKAAAKKKEEKEASPAKKTRKKAGVKRAGMEYIDVVNFVREKLKTTDPAVIAGKAAYQIDLAGQGHGIFYIEIVDGFLAVEPYDYRDRDARLEVIFDDLLDIVEKKLDFEQAVREGRVFVDGNWDRAMELKKLFDQL